MSINDRIQATHHLKTELDRERVALDRLKQEDEISESKRKIMAQIEINIRELKKGLTALGMPDA